MQTRIQSNSIQAILLSLQDRSWPVLEDSTELFWSGWSYVIGLTRLPNSPKLRIAGKWTGTVTEKLTDRLDCDRPIIRGSGILTVMIVDVVMCGAFSCRLSSLFDVRFYVENRSYSDKIGSDRFM